MAGNDEEGRIVWSGGQFVNCAWDDDRDERSFTCNHSLSQSFAIGLHHFSGPKGRKRRFRRDRTAKTTTMLGSFEGPATGSIVLDAMVEKKKPLLGTIYCFSRSQSDFITLANTAGFPHFFDAPKPQQGGRTDL